MKLTGCDRNEHVHCGTKAARLTDLTALSRPRTCDKTPFSEAQFKTMKYHPDSPPDSPHPLASIHQAMAFGRHFFPWYNDQHHHPGTAGLIPFAVHYGYADEVLDRRHHVLLEAYQRHPGPVVVGPPRRPQLPEAVSITPQDHLKRGSLNEKRRCLIFIETFRHNAQN